MLSLLLGFLIACGSSHEVPTDATTVDTGNLPDSSPTTTTFSYSPSWAGVTAVEVVGELQGGTWGTLATLSPSGATWTGTADLAPGSYDYLLHIVGDSDAGSNAGTYERLAIDPAQSAFEVCPADAPSFTENPKNPCGLLAVPTTAPVLHHVTGKVMVGTNPGAGFLVLIERQETGGHHFFANRVTTGTDGTYDFAVANGSYRIQVDHPDYEAKTDAQLDPKTLKIMRRDISSSIAVTADLAFSDAMMAEPKYNQFSPITTAPALPTTFSFPTGAAKLTLYGTGARIGDPWFSSTVTDTGSMPFDGTFNTDKAKTAAVVLGTQYWWGIEQTTPGTGGGAAWTQQSMVFPIQWPAGS